MSMVQEAPRCNGMVPSEEKGIALCGSTDVVVVDHGIDTKINIDQFYCASCWGDHPRKYTVEGIVWWEPYVDQT